MSALIKFSNLAFFKDGLALFCYFDLATLNRGEILDLFVYFLLIKIPPKRQNIGHRTSAAKRKREERQNETEETAQRNEGNRLYMSQSYATESSQQHEARNEARRVRIRELRQSL
ncbi:hypothetical protein AVEN_49444-1 [Araneus ventricosus]|uniref:Uncharacterized protein n=1 Tax=Araneus ventricosus TaxID=182803 RepID=A0A4Y2CQJ6_ARAVE|nr:hypothetical protein AVEN_49444-1 [Araneus ventricosus]